MRLQQNLSLQLAISLPAPPLCSGQTGRGGNTGRFRGPYPILFLSVSLPHLPSFLLGGLLTQNNHAYQPALGLPTRRLLLKHSASVLEALAELGIRNSPASSPVNVQLRMYLTPSFLQGPPRSPDFPFFGPLPSCIFHHNSTPPTCLPD